MNLRCCFDKVVALKTNACATLKKKCIKDKTEKNGTETSGFCSWLMAKVRILKITSIIHGDINDGCISDITYIIHDGFYYFNALFQCFFCVLFSNNTA